MEPVDVELFERFQSSHPLHTQISVAVLLDSFLTARSEKDQGIQVCPAGAMVRIDPAKDPIRACTLRTSPSKERVRQAPVNRGALVVNSGSVQLRSSLLTTCCPRTSVTSKKTLPDCFVCVCMHLRG